MYVILVYDVGVKRVAKVCLYLRQYLNWIQNSVFEGELTPSELAHIRSVLKKMLRLDSDSVQIYKVRSEKFIKKEYLGIKKAEPSTVI